MKDTIAHNVKHISFGGRGSLLYLDYKTDYMEWGGIVMKNFRLKCQKIKEIM